MKLKTSITLVFTLLFMSFIQGQGNSEKWHYGELFLKNGESKKGFIKFGLHSKALSLGRGDQTVLFKTNRKGKKEKFPESKVNNFILGSANYTYVPVSLNKRKLFRVVTKGKASLYHRYVYGGIANNGTNMGSFDEEYYILMEGESKAKLYLADKVLSLRKKALKYFSDCPSLVKKLKDKTYNRSNYQDIVNEYNKCDVSH